MTSAEILQMPLLDLVFENRNKLYGAYALRKHYNQRLFFALSLSVVVSITLLLLLRNNNNVNRDARTIPDEVFLRTIKIPESPKPPEPPRATRLQPPTAPVVQKTETQVRIVKDPIQSIDVPTQTDLSTAVPSNATTGDLPVFSVPPMASQQGGTKTKLDEKPATGPAYLAPEFPGGAEAWANFLRRNLQVPETLDAGEKKTVLVKFLVSEAGAVTGFEVVQSGGAVFDAEVIRVLKRMPKWKPALQNGQPTAVSFTQPVTFVAMGD